MSFGSQIRNRLLDRGLSQSSFADKLGISRARLNNYLMGRSEPGYELLKAMARELEVSIDELLEFAPPREKIPAGSSPYGLEAVPEMVVSPHRPQDDPGPFAWVPLYKTKSLLQKHDTTLNHPSAWLRVLDKNVLRLGDKESYALLIDDMTMAPVFRPGDIVFIRPEISYLFMQNTDNGAYFAVRTNGTDNPGFAIRRCYMHGELLSMVALNPDEPPIVLNLAETAYVPIVGRVLTMTRSFTNVI